MSSSEDKFKNTNQLITAQPQQDWGWNFDVFQWEVKS